MLAFPPPIQAPIPVAWFPFPPTTAEANPEASSPVALIGSVFKQREMLLPAMREAMEETGEDAAFVDPMFPPSVGAALMALEKSGAGIDADVLRTLRRCCAGPDAPPD